jgi:hypothetical protein
VVEQDDNTKSHRHHQATRSLAAKQQWLSVEPVLRSKPTARVGDTREF